MNLTIDQQYKTFLKMKGSMSAKAKGDAGEDLAFAVLRKIQKRSGGVIIRGYKYKYARKKSGEEYPGTPMYKDNKLVSYQAVSKNKSTTDEIDLLYISQFCVMPIEVKAYGSRSGIILWDHWWKYDGTSTEDKYPLAQEEKHCRQLYHHIFDLLPAGNPAYIRPLVLFVDKQVIEDQRSPEFKKAILVSNLNFAGRAISALNRPGKAYINSDIILSRLKTIQTAGDSYK